MQRERETSLDILNEFLRRAFTNLPDSRKGTNTQYTVADAATCAFSTFFTQEPSFLSYQRDMHKRYRSSNEQTVFHTNSIPSDTQIRRLLDEVAPQTLDRVFWDCITYVESEGKLDVFRTTLGNNDLLVALDGTWYFSSEKIHCKNCLRKRYEGNRLYYHAMINPVLAVPGKTQVLALPAEFITNSDGENKQDCEQNAAKRWLKGYGDKIGSMNVTILGDDLYAHEPICREILAQGCNFILVCKEDSHKTVYEWIKGITEEKRVERVTGVRKITKETWIYHFVNEIPVADSKEPLLVNWCDITILDEKGERKYHNAFVTNHTVTAENVEDITAAGRARWKIENENENNNTLKNHGYHLEHNFGHGKQYLSQLLAVLNMLAFCFHTIMEIIDPLYQQVRKQVGRRDELFNAIRCLLSRFLYKNFSSLLRFMLSDQKKGMVPI